MNAGAVRACESVRTPGRIYLRGPDGLHPDFARRRAQVLGRRGPLTLQHQTTLLLQKLCLLEAQRLALVTVLDGREVLARGVDETARENQPASEQQRQARERAHVALAMHREVLSVRG